MLTGVVHLRVLIGLMLTGATQPDHVPSIRIIPAHLMTPTTSTLALPLEAWEIP